MNKTLLAAMALTVATGACARLNPVNWFGESTPAPIEVPDAPVAAPDPRPLIAQITALRVEETAGGAIVRATGLPPTQGYWQPALIPRPLQDGVQVYDFRILPPEGQHPAGTPASREVTAAAGLTAVQLGTIRQIVVQGQGNALSSAR